MKQIMLALAKIAAFKDLNFSRDPEGKLFENQNAFKELVESLANSGWNPAEGVLEVWALGQEWDTAVENRPDVAVGKLQRDWESYKDTANPEDSLEFRNAEGKKVVVAPAHFRLAFEAVHVHKDKIIRPTHANVYGFRRMAALPTANALRIADGKEPILEIPVIERQFNSLAELKAACARENWAKSTGTQKLTNADKVRCIMQLFHEQYREADFMKHAGFKRGDAQRAHRFGTLCNRYPNLHIPDQCVSGKVNFATLGKEEIKKILDANPRKTEEEVQAYLLNPKGESANATKIASKDKIEAVSQQHPVYLIQYVCDAIMANDLPRLNGTFVDEEIVSALNKGIQEVLGSRINLQEFLTQR